MVQFFKLLALILLLIVSLLSALSYFAVGHHYLELLSHFRLQYLAIQLSSLIFLLVLKEKRFSILAFLCTILNLVPILPYYIPEFTPKTSFSRLKVMQVNVYGPNQEHAKVLNLIRTQNPDIIGLEEVRPHWSEALLAQLKDYPYRIVEPEQTAFGIALFSKLPLYNAHIEKFGQPFGSSKRMFPSIIANVTLAKQTVSVLVTHPLPPMRGFSVRNSQLEDIAFKRTHFQPNMLIIGDLNVTPWSPYFQRFIYETHMKDSQLGFGVQSSWKSPIPGILLPIDHVLVSKKFVVIRRTLGPDHLPVILELSLQQ